MAPRHVSGSVFLLAVLAALAIAALPQVAIATGCNPFTFPYKTIHHQNPRDCRVYTLFDVYAGCMPNYSNAREVCSRQGLELAPWDNSVSKDSLLKLCAGNRYTCWTGGKAEPNLCPLMDAHGIIQQQGCHQPVRFVCRTKESRCPVVPPTCDPHTFAYTTITHVSPHDRKTYTLFDTKAQCMVNWSKAKAVCERKGLVLAPWDEHNSYKALSSLCAGNRYTCWTGGKADPNRCPLMDAHGIIQQQGCEQLVRWVCRTK